MLLSFIETQEKKIDTRKFETQSFQSWTAQKKFASSSWLYPLCVCDTIARRVVDSNNLGIFSVAVADSTTEFSSSNRTVTHLEMRTQQLQNEHSTLMSITEKITPHHTHKIPPGPLRQPHPVQVGVYVYPHFIGKSSPY